MHAMKVYGERWSLAPLILNLGSRWMWIVNFTLRPLFSPGKERRHP